MSWTRIHFSNPCIELPFPQWGEIAKECLKIYNFCTGWTGDFKCGPQIHLNKQLNDFVYQLYKTTLEVQNNKKVVPKIRKIKKKCLKKLVWDSKISVFMDAESNETIPRAVWLTFRGLWLLLKMRSFLISFVVTPSTFSKILVPVSLVKLNLIGRHVSVEEGHLALKVVSNYICYVRLLLRGKAASFNFYVFLSTSLMAFTWKMFLLYFTGGVRNRGAFSAVLYILVLNIKF